MLLKTKRNLLIILMYCIVNTIYAQKTCTSVDELTRKRHKVNGMTYGHPYTMFDRHNGSSFAETLINIRTNLRSIAVTHPLSQSYQQLYNHANTPLSTYKDDGIVNATNESSTMAEWAKNNAFVFLIGLAGR